MHQSIEGTIFMSVKTPEFLIEAGLEALGRLLNVAQGDGPVAARIQFLLAWHNAEENGPIDLWNVGAGIGDDMPAVIRLIRELHSYPGDLGFNNEMDAVWGPEETRRG